MQKFILALILTLFTFPVFAQESSDAVSKLTPIKPEYVCMVNNTAFDKPQIPIKVDGNVYYGCCSMCKERLEKDSSVRTATDPVSGKEIDKAKAIIGKAADGSVYYFENEANMERYQIEPEPHDHDHQQ